MQFVLSFDRLEHRKQDLLTTSGSWPIYSTFFFVLVDTGLVDVVEFADRDRPYWREVAKLAGAWHAI